MGVPLPLPPPGVNEVLPASYMPRAHACLLSLPFARIGSVVARRGLFVSALAGPDSAQIPFDVCPPWAIAAIRAQSVIFKIGLYVANYDSAITDVLLRLRRCCRSFGEGSNPPPRSISP